MNQSDKDFVNQRDKLIKEIELNLNKSYEIYKDNNLLNKIDLCEARHILIKAKFYFECHEDYIEKLRECRDDLIKASSIFELNNCS